MITHSWFFIFIIFTACSGPDSSETTGPKIGNVIYPIIITSNPIVFVTTVPVVSMQGQLNAFGNHGTSIVDSIPGGDLYIRYPSGALKNLTESAGYGVKSSGIQEGKKPIAVRQPTVHWSGNKVIFSMLVGGPKERFDRAAERRWQIYEAFGLGENDVVTIRKIPYQSSKYNNFSPVYGANDDIFFVSDAPLYDMKHTYPQLDEYESTPTNTGIWKIDLNAKKVSMIQHAPSGSFDLYVDSFGRILFTKWDHLKRDQQADADRYDNGKYKAFDFPNENPDAKQTSFPEFDENGKLIADKNGVLYELFPEARSIKDPTKDPNESINNLNQFFVWQINEDGSEEETMNHVGRHEFGGSYMPPVFLDDPNLTDRLPLYSANIKMRETFAGNAGIFQLKEDIDNPGTYMGTYAMEFGRETAGRIVEFNLPPGKNPETVVMTDYTNPTLDYYPDRTTEKLPSMTGHYRNPLRLTDRTILVSHTPEYRLNEDDSIDPGTTRPRYIFQLKKLIPNPLGADMIAGAPFTGGIVKHIRWWTDAEKPKEYLGPLNEVDAVELRPRPRPIAKMMATNPIEKSVLDEEGVDEQELKKWMMEKKLALIVSRNVTMRDRADVSQPFNLRIPGGTQNVPTGGKIYDISKLQFFQGELTRSYLKQSGRRVYSRPVRNTLTHPDIEKFYTDKGNVELGLDGSMAAFVPAGRALSWQLVDPDGKAVVRERVWVSFAPGEIRTCASCHGINSVTHNNLPEPINKPEALRNLIKNWKNLK
ncbi:hypothetical protein SHI21_16475 [Bacteriovorax sp. PP10]|uniref:Hydrazine synthase alpha subunit middle domain-containing protein n=1 Tax=Bacteriovorax antarcticus TaxID=3088717 RepID=A0ABU5VXP0_9BACT|nr:hypothetical protein [Bacteriovorax sp. PP10]MEA9357828.1 hypothetical protein [Bacteriovorax sp. PP10]